MVVVKIPNIHFKTGGEDGKNFRVGDLIEFGQKPKGKPYIYLIYVIEVEFDYSKSSEKSVKIEKQDDSLPDMKIVLKTHPII